MRQAILFLTTKSNSWALNAFSDLERSKIQNADVYYVYHQQGEMLPVSLQNIKKLFTFTSDIFSELGYTPIVEGQLIPGSNHFPLLKFFKEKQRYDFYWMVEDDIRFTGEWNAFFDSFVNSDSDFLSSFIETKEQRPNWSWWSYLTTNDNIVVKQLLKSFNPIYRLSHQALACVDEHLLNGWMGHHEILLPTLLFNEGFKIEDIGGKGIFVEDRNKYKFYDESSMNIAPLLPDGRKNYLFHPVKEEKQRKDGPCKKNAVFVTVGAESLHRQLLKGDADFDLHLLIYDGSYNKFCDDSDFICCQSGYKMDMTYHYINRHPEYLEKYDYFFLMDDDVEMNTEEVNKLFYMMRVYKLKIAQPSLVMSYYTYEHTLHNPLCVLRYTNFVEMMIPCFSKEAFVKVLPTFKEKIRFKGIEYHWENFVGKGIAIIDDVVAVHTRPIRSFDKLCFRRMEEYLKENHLEKSIRIYRFCPHAQFVTNFSEIIKEKNDLDKYGYQTIGNLMFQMQYSELVPVVAFYCLYAFLMERRSFLDIALRAVSELYFRHREDVPAKVSLQELKKMSLFLSCYVKYNHFADIFFLLLERPDNERSSSLEEAVGALRLNLDYGNSELMEKIKYGIDKCLNLIKKIKTN